VKRNKFYISILILFLSVFSVFGQTRKQLEAQRKKLNKEIKQVNTLLFNEIKKEKNALDALKDIFQKIEVRTQLISTIHLEAAILSKEITANQMKLTKLSDKLVLLKKDYAAMIFKSYKSRSQESRTMFLLSSQSFLQAYKRLGYMKQYTSFRKKQGEDIGEQTTTVQRLNDSLILQKTLKDSLIVFETGQQKQIELDKINQEKLITVIKKNESKYKKALQNKIKQEKRVTLKIDKKIREEIARANRIAKEKEKEKNKLKRVKKNEFILTPEAKALAAKFELNKGKLPWPVNEGIVVRKFGKQPHPSFPGITINGSGLHIVTRQGKEAQAIFSGSILNVLVSSEGRKNVLIQHGNYISSYNNLENVYVSRGEKIVTNQKIGQIFTDKISKKTTLIFVLFKNTMRLNPAHWILKR